MLSISFKVSFSQPVITTIGKIIFVDSPDSSDSKALHRIAKVCNRYLKKYYFDERLPLVLLDVQVTKDTSYWQLGYDNLYGNSVERGIAQHKSYGTTILGVRIKSAHTAIDPEAILKLFEYGIDHEDELKDLWTRALKLDYFERPKGVSLSKNQISRILNRPLGSRLTNLLAAAN
jgi:hypothetical protein